jgi:hypothetical protein
MSRGTMTSGSPASELAPGRGEAMPRRQRGDEAFALHHDVLELAGARHRRQQQAEVELAGGERRRLLGREHLAQRERDARARGLECLQQPGQHAVVGERDEADAQAPFLAARHAAHLLHRALELADDAPCLAQEPRALGRELDPPPAAGEQHHAEPRLQRADRARQRRLGDVQRRRGAAEVQALGHRQEIPQLP